MAKKNSRTKPPSFQFYYQDWLSDNRLKRASKNAKGVWIDLICISYDMPIPGIFSDENGALFEREIVEMLTGKTANNLNGFRELVKRNIIKRTGDGTFYVKRVKGDTKLSRTRKECGKLGGNPNLVAGLVNQTDNQKGNQKQPSSISSSISSSLGKNNTPYIPHATFETNPETDIVYERWAEKNGGVGVVEYYYKQWRQAVAAYGKELCLKYIEDTKATKPGFIINKIDKDSATGKLPQTEAERAKIAAAAEVRIKKMEKYY